jgi:glycopeptide antibiotics resistance protein
VPETTHAGGGSPVGPVSRVPAYVFLLAVIGFIIYGSLFPFDFASRALPIDRFYAEYDLFANRSDAIDNFFLFVPLGIGLHLSFRHATARLAALILSVLVLAIGIQLVQLYLPSRTASVADSFWNTVGMGAGLLLASRVRNAFQAQLSARTSGRDDFMVCLIILWFLYESFPFVPTLDIGELRAHVKSAIFAPPFEFMRLFQHGLAAALAGIAVTRLGLLRRPVLGVIGLGGLSMVLEVCVAYGSLRRETLLGIALGLATGYVVAHRLRVRSQDIAFGLALCAFLITVLTPYRGQALDPGFTWTPFSHLLWQGIVKDVPPSAFEALAIGALLWSGMAGPYRFRNRPYLWSAIVLLLLAGLEWVRVSLAGFHADTTALVMAIVMAPAAVALRVDDVTASTQRGDRDSIGAHGTVTASAPAARSALALLACAAAALTLGLWLLLHLPGIPYNLKNLFGNHVLIGAGVFSLALLWLGSGPWVVARMVIQLDARRRHGAMWAPLLLIGIALVSFALVNLATPEIMLDKIIGAPDLYRRIVDENYWGDAWRSSLSAWPRGVVTAGERVVRYVALYSVFAVPMVVALLALPRQDRRPRVLINLICLLPCWLLAKYVVLDWAITDNLTELVADGGTVFLAALIALFSVNAVSLVAWARRPRTFPVLAIATAGLALAGWWLLNQGIETLVINNGRMFGGVQFLLGENRTTLLSAPALLARWCAVYSSGLAVVVVGMLLSMRLLPLPTAADKKPR